MAEDDFNDGLDHSDPLIPLNTKKIPDRQTAVAVKDERGTKGIPTIAAAGRGKFAEEIIALAQEHGIKIREDKDLAELLAKLELDSPVPSEALLAVAEILTYVYKANNQPDPFNAVLEEHMKRDTHE